MQRGGLGWRQKRAKRGWTATGAAPVPSHCPSSPYPLALSPVAFGDTCCPHGASCALLGIVGVSSETVLGGRSRLRSGDCCCQVCLALKWSLKVLWC